MENGNSNVEGYWMEYWNNYWKEFWENFWNSKEED